MTSAPLNALRAEHAILRDRAIMAPLVGRSQIELSGADRAAFLHQLTTHNIKALVAGTGCETFLCNAQGKTVGHGYVFCGADALILDSSANQAAGLLAHLDRFLIREKVVLRDRTSEWIDMLLAGPASASMLKAIGAVELPGDRCGHVDNVCAGVPVSVRRVDYVVGDCFFLSTDVNQLEALSSALVAAGATVGSAALIESARIEAGTPLFGLDISTDNLPQELARDHRAISFEKGCYLGQETVARLDALGHVNRLLVGVRWKGQEIPAAGCQLFVDDKPVGQVTSASWSWTLEAPLALAFVRRAHSRPGQSLQSPIGPAEVVPLPVC